MIGSRAEGLRRGAKSSGLIDLVSVLSSLVDRGIAKPHLTTVVRVRGKTGWQSLQALIDSGATLNFISQLRVKELGLTPRAAENIRISSIGGQPVQVYGMHSTTLRIHDTKGNRRDTATSLLGISIMEYDVVLGMSWLTTYDPDIRWSTRRWSWRNHGKIFGEKQPAIRMVNAESFYATMKNEGLQGMIFHLRESGVPEAYLYATEEVQLPERYKDYADVFSEEGANQLPKHGPQDHAIELTSGTPPFGPLYNLSAVELQVLREYIEDNLEKGFIR